LKASTQAKERAGRDTVVVSAIPAIAQEAQAEKTESEEDTDDADEDFMAAAFGSKTDRIVSLKVVKVLEYFDNIYEIMKETSQSTYVHC